MEKFTINLGSKEWDIESPLKFRQLRIIEPAMSKIIAMRADADAGKTEMFYDEMAIVILTAINNKAVTRETLDEMPVKVSDLVSAVQTIAQAAGMWKAPNAGEAPGKAPPNAPSP